MASIGSKLRQRRRRSSGRRYIQLYTNVKRSAAYHGLSLPARCALIELMDRYYGINNGMIGLGVRELAYELRCSQGCASKALRELDDSGLARPVTGGLWKGKRATEWRLTFKACNKTGALPTLNWTARQVFTSESTKVHQRKHKAPKCSPAKAHKPKNPMNDPAKCPPGDTHIDIYHMDTELEGNSLEPDKPEPFPELPDFLHRDTAH
jgi:hypothetical protein